MYHQAHAYICHRRPIHNSFLFGKVEMKLSTYLLRFDKIQHTAFFNSTAHYEALAVKGNISFHSKAHLLKSILQVV